MKRTFFGLVILIIVCALVLFLQRNTQGFERVGIVLSFDDRSSIESWGNARAFLKSRGIKATFFVDKFDTLTDEQLQILRQLIIDGHEIGSHGFRHLNARQALSGDLTLQQYVQAEIEPSIQHMRQLGFEPRSFAYPHGAFTHETDQALTNYFQIIRKVGKRNAFYDRNNGSFIGAIYIDIPAFKASKLPGILDEALRQRTIISLSGHKIGPVGGNYWCSYDVLERLAEEARKRGLPFVTMSQLRR